MRRFGLISLLVYIVGNIFPNLYKRKHFSTYNYLKKEYSNNLSKKMKEIIIQDKNIKKQISKDLMFERVSYQNMNSPIISVGLNQDERLAKINQLWNHCCEKEYTVKDFMKELDELRIPQLYIID